MALSIVGAGLALGAQHFPVLVAVCLLLLAAALCVTPELARVPGFSWLAYGLAALTALQAVPLPRGLVEMLSPNAAQVWLDAAASLGAAAPGFVSLSLDPGASAVQALLWLCYGLAFTACVGVRQQRGSDWLAALVFVAAVAVGVVTLVHGALGLDRVYGFYLPRAGGTERWTFGPFINSNNLAGYLNAGCFAGLALLVTGRGPFSPFWLRAGLGLLILQSILAGSRAGVATLALGLLGFGVVFLRRQGATLGRGLVLVISCAALALLVGGDSLLRLLGEREFERKVSAWAWSLRLVPDFPAFGVGRGAFETAFPPYRGSFDSDWNAVFTHPENFVIQWLVEWGVPATAVLVVAGVALLLPALRRARRDLLAACLLTGLCVLAVQNLADLGLELPAIGLIACLLVAGADIRSEAPRTQPARLYPPLLGAAAAAALLLTLARSGHATVQADRLAIADLYQRHLHGRVSRAEIDAAVATSIRRHPGEPYFDVIGGLVALRADDPRALRWAAQALERAPVSGQAHMLAAGALRARGGTPQALTHLRRAAVYDAELRGHAFDLAAAWAQGKAAPLIAAFPADVPGAELLASACRRLPTPEQIGCLGAVVDRGAVPLAVAEQLAELLWPALLHQAEPCARDSARCRSLLTRCAAELGRGAGARWRADQAAARLLALDGRLAEAAKGLLAACAKPNVPAECHRSALDLALRAENPELITRAADARVKAACPGGQDCALAHDDAARAYEQLKSPARALQHRTAAADAEPSFERWAAVASAALDSGLRPVAKRALQRAKHSDGDTSPAQRERLSALEARAMASVP